MNQGTIVTRRVRCYDCDGTGEEQIPCGPDDRRCEFCEGRGWLDWPADQKYPPDHSIKGSRPPLAGKLPGEPRADKEGK